MSDLEYRTRNGLASAVLPCGRCRGVLLRFLWWWRLRQRLSDHVANSVRMRTARLARRSA